MTKQTEKEFNIDIHQSKISAALNAAGINKEVLEKILIDAEPVQKEIEDIENKIATIDKEKEKLATKMNSKKREIDKTLDRIKILPDIIKQIENKVEVFQKQYSESENGIIVTEERLNFVVNKFEEAEEELAATKLELEELITKLPTLKNEYNVLKEKFETEMAKYQQEYESLKANLKKTQDTSQKLRAPQILAANFKKILFSAINTKLKELSWDKKTDGKPASAANEAGILYTLAKLEGTTGKGKAHAKKKCIENGWEADAKFSKTINSAPKNCRYSKSQFQKLVFETYKEVMTNGFKPSAASKIEPFAGFGGKVAQILSVPVKEKTVIAEEPKNKVNSKKIR